jgi:ABC-type glycerol-3-phosphate transport system substrate-binding protein
MRARITTVAVLAALTLTACSSSDSSDDKPSKPATTSAAPTADPAEARQTCVDAVAALPADENGEVPSEPVPDACKTLNASDYLDAYMDGIEQSNQAGRDALQDLIDEASEDAQP